MSNKIKVAVVGVGHLGKFHAEKYHQLPHCHLIAVSDSNEDQAKTIAEKYDVQATTDYKTLVDKVEAVTIATPTNSHYEIAAFFLNQGIHVLLEKPITTTLEEADILIALASRNNLILQVGHLERFNSVVQHAKSIIKQPLFIESLRIATFKPRSTDVNVILDLMIHDIDIIQYLMQSRITHVAANGAPVATSHIDIGNARLEFENGAVANVTASRVSLKSQRLFRIFQKNAYISMDLQKKRLAIHQKDEDVQMLPGIPDIICDEIDCPTNDALTDQACAFLTSIKSGEKPMVTAEEGRNALLSALQITETLTAHNKKYMSNWEA